MDRLVLFLRPNPTGEASLSGQPRSGDMQPHRVWCKRFDRGGSEGFVEDTVLGGRWVRRYECWAEAFPVEDGERLRPTPLWGVEGDDGERLRIESVVEVESGPHPVKLAVHCYRSTS